MIENKKFIQKEEENYKKTNKEIMKEIIRDDLKWKKIKINVFGIISFLISIISLLILVAYLFNYKTTWNVQFWIFLWCFIFIWLMMFSSIFFKPIEIIKIWCKYYSFIILYWCIVLPILLTVLIILIFYLKIEYSWISIYSIFSVAFFTVGFSLNNMYVKKRSDRLELIENKFYKIQNEFILELNENKFINYLNLKNYGISEKEFIKLKEIHHNFWIKLNVLKENYDIEIGCLNNCKNNNWNIEQNKNNDDKKYYCKSKISINKYWNGKLDSEWNIISFSYCYKCFYK